MFINYFSLINEINKEFLQNFLIILKKKKRNPTLYVRCLSDRNSRRTRTVNVNIYCLSFFNDKPSHILIDSVEAVSDDTSIISSNIHLIRFIL